MTSLGASALRKDSKGVWVVIKKVQRALIYLLILIELPYKSPEFNTSVFMSILRQHPTFRFCTNNHSSTAQMTYLVSQWVHK